MAQVQENNMTLEEFLSKVELYREQISQYNHNIPPNIQEIHTKFCTSTKEIIDQHPEFYRPSYIMVRHVKYVAATLIDRLNAAVLAREDGEGSDTDSISDYHILQMGGESLFDGDDTSFDPGYVATQSYENSFS